MIQKQSRLSAFTLVELIVVIVILGVLATIGFVSYSGYLGGARDGNRITQLKNINDSLVLYGTTKNLPLPDDYVSITASGTTVGYQGYAGENVLELINYTSGGKDPKDDQYFTYYLTKDRKNLQLMALMEEQESISFLPDYLLPHAYAADYSERYPKVYGQKLGVLVSAEENSLNTPAQEISANKTSGTLELLTAPESYTALLSNSESFTASGYTLGALMNTRLGKKAPSECPTGFIGVPGNPEFNTKGFCVAQYEMTYSDADTPNSTGGGTDWNTVAYVSGKQITSEAGKYPIVDINQTEAIAACQSMGRGYHLITNNEWMTIARSIEANPSNWSSGTIGVGNLYNGVSNNTTLGCNAEGGNTDPRTYATKTGPGDTSCNPRRSHKLAQGGGTIWDLSGNLYEHVNKANSVDGSGYNTGQTALAGSSAPTGWDNDGLYTAADMQKYGAATGLGTAGGIGNIYYTQGVASNIFLRGGHAINASTAGVFTLTLSSTAGSEYRHIGFRCAL